MGPGCLGLGNRIPKSFGDADIDYAFEGLEFDDDEQSGHQVKNSEKPEEPLNPHLFKLPNGAKLPKGPCCRRVPRTQTSRQLVLWFNFFLPEVDTRTTRAHTLTRRNLIVDPYSITLAPSPTKDSTEG